MATTLEFNSSTFSLEAQFLSLALDSKSEKLRSLQYHNLLSSCVLGSPPDPCVVQNLFSSIESSFSCEKLASRSFSSFDFFWNHLGLALFKMNTSSADSNEHQNAIGLIIHYLRIVKSNDFPKTREKLLGLLNGDEAKKAKRSEAEMRMLEPLAVSRKWLLGCLVLVKHEVGMIVPFVKNRDEEEGNDDDDEEADSSDDDDNEGERGKKKVSTLHVHFFLSNRTVRIDEIDVLVTDAWETRVLFLLVESIRAHSREACAFVAQLLLPCSPSTGLMSQVFQQCKTSSFLCEACGVFFCEGNAFLAEELLARHIASCGMWVPDLALRVLMKLPHEIPFVYIGSFLVDQCWTLQASDFLIRPGSSSSLSSWIGWQVMDKRKRWGCIVAQQQWHDSSVFEVEWGPERKRETIPGEEICLWLFRPLRKVLTVHELFAQNLDAFALLGKRAILFGIDGNTQKRDSTSELQQGRSQSELVQPRKMQKEEPQMQKEKIQVKTQKEKESKMHTEVILPKTQKEEPKKQTEVILPKTTQKEEPKMQTTEVTQRRMQSATLPKMQSNKEETLSKSKMQIEELIDLTAEVSPSVQVVFDLTMLDDD